MSSSILPLLCCPGSWLVCLHTPQNIHAAPRTQSPASVPSPSPAVCRHPHHTLWCLHSPTLLLTQSSYLSFYIFLFNMIPTDKRLCQNHSLPIHSHFFSPLYSFSSLPTFLFQTPGSGLHPPSSHTACYFHTAVPVCLPVPFDRSGQLLRSMDGGMIWLMHSLSISHADIYCK